MHRKKSIVLFSLLASGLWPSDAAAFEQRFRRPASLAISSDHEWLYTANRQSGSISIVDIANRSVVDEIEVGGMLSDVVALADGTVLVLDEQNHRLRQLTRQGQHWTTTSKIDVASYPVCMVVDHDSNRCFLSSLWSQVVTMVDLLEADHQPHQSLRIAKTLHLPFEPREMCLTKDGKRLIVAGSFDAKLAVIAADDLELMAIHDVAGHNIRGLAVSSDGDRLLVAQQELNPLARSTRDDVHWGNLITNVLVSIDLAQVCNPEANLSRRRVVTFLGEPGNAAGDPGPIATGPEGELAILLGGVNEVALGKDVGAEGFHRIPVGRRPTAAVRASNGRLLIADQFSDTVSIVDVAAQKLIDQIPLGPQAVLNPAENGEMLFFDSRLSHDGWMSCHSCHTDGHSNGQLNDNVSDGSFDTPKRVLSLRGVGQTRPWAWTGHIEALEQQVANSVTKTMQGETLQAEQIAALVAFMESLPAPPGLSDRIAQDDVAEIRRGADLFSALDCQQCHAPPTFTTAMSYDVGLEDAAGNAKFNPPSLRGVGRRTAFFHDARAASLAEVFSLYQHQLTRQLSEAELNSLLHYLMSI